MERLFGVIIIFIIAIIVSNFVTYNWTIDRMNYLADSLRGGIDTHAWEIKHLLKDKMTKIDKIRNRVLYSKDTYEPNDVLDIIDEITDIIESEDAHE